MDKAKQTSHKTVGQLFLMTSRRFAPFFWTQFLGAFNDNLFKNGLVILIAYGTGNVVSANSDIFLNLAAGLFILPFFLFSATAGQMADKYEKSMLIRRIKIAEIMIMGMAAVAFLYSAGIVLIFLLFLMGTQSAFFGPIKYSIIPDHLNPDEIVGGNALVEMGTFVAILLGLIAGNLLNPVEFPPVWIALAVCLVAVLGWLASRFIPEAQPPAPDLVIGYNPLTQTMKTIACARRIRPVFLSILAISWFWFLGMAYLTQLPNYTKKVLYGTYDVYTLLLTIFSIGIGFGSMLCERLSGRKIELGLVPLGSLGITVFGTDLFFATPAANHATLIGIPAFIHSAENIRVLFDLLMIGVFGGIYIVPLFAFIQTRTEQKIRARVIAANNILNAFLMVMAAVAGILLLGVLNLSVPEFFLALAIMNIVVAAYIYTVVPEFVMRFLIWMITHTIYRVRHANLGTIPSTGPAVLVCNRFSHMDALILAGACRRPVRFVMPESIFRIPVLSFIFKTGRAIPIISKRENPAAYNAALDSISNALEKGEAVCIFPEGELAADGETGLFKPGIEKNLQKVRVPVIPIALHEMGTGFFCHSGGPPMRSLPCRFWPKITIQAGNPVAPEEVSADEIRERLLALMGTHR